MRARIAMISEHASPLAVPGSVDSGGQNVYVAQVARQLVELGLEVDIFTRRDSREQMAVKPWLPGVRVIHVAAGPAEYLPKERLLPYMDEFARNMLAFMHGGRRYDCIHANFFMSALVGCELKRHLGIPLVVTFHALGKVRLLHQAAADGFPPERVAIEQRAMREADLLIAECPQDIDDQVTQYRADRNKIRMVACGFDASEVSPMQKSDACRELGIDPHPFTVLQLGRMVPRKGVDDVIRGFAQAVRGGLVGRLLIVGCDVIGAGEESPELRRLRVIATDEAISDWVTFVGQCGRDVIRNYYCAADVFVTAPWYEPFGITPLEAMACARPVIGSKVGGIQFTVRNGETGFHVPPHAPDAIAGRLLQLYRDPKLCERLGRQALSWVRARFTWRQVAEELAEIYAELAAERSSNPLYAAHEKSSAVPVNAKAFL